MNSVVLISRPVISALLFTLVLVGCGVDSPESMLASAKDYMVKNDTKAAVIQLKNVLQINPNLGEARILLGKALLNSGDPTAAEVELRKASDLKQPDDQVMPLLARAQLMLGQKKKLTDSFSKVQLTTPDSNADLQTTVGQAYLNMGNREAAQAAFKSALNAIADYGPALIGQARIKASDRDLPGALALLETALDKTPKLYEAWQLKGDILTIQGDNKGAAGAYRIALEIMPDNVIAHYSLILRLMEDGNLGDAEKQLAAMKKLAPTHPHTNFLQAQLYYHQKNYKAAQAAIQQSLKILPDYTLALQLAGAIEYELKSYSMAETYLVKALPKTKELGLARRILIASYLRSGQPAKALVILQPILNKIDNNSNMLALAGEVFLQNGNYEKAGTYFEKSAALDPTNANKRTSVALSHLSKGETDTAYRELEEISSVDVGIKSDIALISSLLRERKYDQALRAISVLEKKQPENPVAKNLRATALIGKGDFSAARQSYEQALAINPAYFSAAASLASLDLSEKRQDDAKKRFNGVLAKDPNNVQALLALAELRAKTGGNTEDVATLINKAIAANPSASAPRLALIGLYLGAKDSRKALAAARDAISFLPDRPEILEAAGQAQVAVEDFNQALATYAKLASLMPNEIRPHLRMAEIQLSSKNKEAAMQSLRKALAIKADSVEAQRGIIVLDLDAGRTSDALAISRQIQKQRPKEAAGYLLEGDIHALKKSWDEAASAYRSGIKQSAATELAVKLHAVLISGGNSAEADKFSDSWLKEHAKDLKFRLYLAELANARKDYVAGSKYYKSLLDIQPNSPVVLNNLAWTLAKMKNPKALEYAERAYKLAPEQPAVIDTLGGLLLENGDTERALDLLQKAFRLAPESTAIRFNFAKALIKAGKKDEGKNELNELAKLGDKFPDQLEAAKLLKAL